MGWLLGVAGGAAESFTKRVDQERAELALQERDMLNTMLPIALENRKERQNQRKRLKEQYNLLTGIVSEDVAQDIMRNGDEFTKKFISKIGDMERETGKDITEADLIESGAIQRQMEVFPSGMKTVTTDQGDVRVRAAPKPVGYRKAGATFDQFMEEIMGTFKDTNVDTDKVKEGILLSFGKVPGHEKALTNSVHRKLAATLGVDSNEVSSLVSGEYDYTDVPFSRDEQFRPTVKMPFVRDKEYYNTQTARLQFEAIERANNLKTTITVDGKEMQVTFQEAVDIIGFQKAKLEFERLKKALITTKGQSEAIKRVSTNDALKRPLSAIADILGGTYTINPVTQEGNFTYKGEIRASKLKDISLRAEGILRNHYFNTVVDNPQFEANQQFASAADLNNVDFLRKVILSAANSLDPSGFLVANLTGEKFDEDHPHSLGVNSFAISDKQSFQRQNDIISQQGRGYYNPQPYAKRSSEDTEWEDVYSRDFTLKIKTGLRTKDITKRVGEANEYQDVVIGQLETFLGRTFSEKDEERIREHLNFGGILQDRKMPFVRKLEAMEENVESLPKLFPPSTGIETKNEVKNQEVEVIETGTETNQVETDQTGTNQVDSITVISRGEKFRWFGRVDGDRPVGQGYFITKDGTKSEGQVDEKGNPTGPFSVTLPNGEAAGIFPHEPSKESSMYKETKESYNILNKEKGLVGGMALGFDKYSAKGKTDDQENKIASDVKAFRKELNEVYKEYEEGKITKENFEKEAIRIGNSVISYVEPLFTEPFTPEGEPISGSFKKGGVIHEEFINGVNAFMERFNLDQSKED